MKTLHEGDKLGDERRKEKGDGMKSATTKHTIQGRKMANDEITKKVIGRIEQIEKNGETYVFFVPDREHLDHIYSNIPKEAVSRNKHFMDNLQKIDVLFAESRSKRETFVIFPADSEFLNPAPFTSIGRVMANSNVEFFGVDEERLKKRSSRRS